MRPTGHCVVLHCSLSESSEACATSETFKLVLYLALMLDCCSAELASVSAVSAILNGLKLGLLVSMTQISHAAFSRTPMTLFLVNCGYDVAVICSAALIMYLM